MLYQDPNGFGVTGDWEAYILGGTQLYFYIFNAAIAASNFLMYLIIFLMIFKMRNSRVQVLVSLYFVLDWHLQNHNIQLTKSFRYTQQPQINDLIVIAKSFQALVKSNHDSCGDSANIHHPQASNSVNATRNVEKGLLAACFTTWVFQALGKLVLNLFSVLAGVQS